MDKIRQKIKELRELLEDHNYYLDNSEQALGYSAALEDIEKFLGSLEPEEPRLTWGDVQLIDTCILECAREEREGKDWGESEEFYTEVLRRYNDFVKRIIPEIVSKIHE